MYGKNQLGVGKGIKKLLKFDRNELRFYFTVAFWFLRNVHVKRKAQCIFKPSYGPGILTLLTVNHLFDILITFRKDEMPCDRFNCHISTGCIQIIMSIILFLFILHHLSCMMWETLGCTKNKHTNAQRQKTF